MDENNLVYRLRKRAEIRRQISTRKSVQEGKPDRISALLEEAANEIERLDKEWNNLNTAVMNKSWSVTVEEDENGDVILPFPDDLIKEYNWQEGDVLSWEVVQEGAKIINISAKEREHREQNNAN